MLKTQIGRIGNGLLVNKEAELHRTISPTRIGNSRKIEVKVLVAKVVALAKARARTPKGKLRPLLFRMPAAYRGHHRRHPSVFRRHQ